MNSQPLSIVTRTQGNNAALKNGTIKLPDLALDFIEIPVLVDAFRRMVRRLEFDICEMALTTYLCAREHGVEFTAIPIFLKRAFHHGAIFHNTDNPIKEPKQLEGCRIGVNRGYTVTAGVWARSILQEEYDEAVKDFLEGNGKGMPSTKVCERLMRFNKEINDKKKRYKYILVLIWM